VSFVFWLNLIILVLLIAGHTELLVAIVNRMGAIKFPTRKLKRLRLIHDVMIPLFAVALIWGVGCKSPGVLVGGSWRELSPAWGIYLTICAAGTCELSWSIIRRSIAKAPGFQISNHSWTVDIAERIAHRPVGNGPQRWLANLPGNEIFQVEVSDKKYTLPRLPREWDGLSILHLTDFHLQGTPDRTFFEESIQLAMDLQPDMAIFTGDLVEQERFLDWLPSTLGRLQTRLGCYFILGNHDWPLDLNTIRSAMTDVGWTDVAGRVVTQDHLGHTLAIGGTERPWIGEHPDFAQAPQDAFRLLLSHTPDHFSWAREQQVDLMCCGHNHGGQIVLPVIGPVYSPSSFGTRYASGVYWEEPTMLYVSRGLSGSHPLRYNCKPELTKLTLHCPANAERSDGSAVP